MYDIEKQKFKKFSWCIIKKLEKQENYILPITLSPCRPTVGSVTILGDNSDQLPPTIFFL